ncbi:MAG: hypothetical protein ACPL06_01540 [Candidatus Anstonellales archaeon]
MKLKLLDDRKKREFFNTVRNAVIFEKMDPYILIRYKGSRPKVAFANYILENLGEIKRQARANKEAISSKNLVFEIEYPPGKQEKRAYIIKMPDFDILGDKRVNEGKARDIEHEFYSNVYLHELLEYPVEYGFKEGQKIVPLPSCLIFNEKTNEIIFSRNSVINTPLSIIAGERVSDVIAENTIRNTAIAAALFTRLGIHCDFHFANIGVDFSSNECGVVFFDLENFTPLTWIRNKEDIPGKIFSSLSSLILVLVGVGIIKNVEQIEMFKKKYIEVNEAWIHENNQKIAEFVKRKTPFASSDKEIALYRTLTELKFKNLANPAFCGAKGMAERINIMWHFIMKAAKMLTTGRV